MKSFIASLLIICSLSVFGQRLRTPTLSPITKISQQIGLTSIDLEYSRPSARGRVVFGELVPYGTIWRTGANASSKLTFSESGFIGGQPVEAGTYALYTIPGEKEWTIIIHTNTSLRSLAGDVYKPEKDLFRFQVPSKSNSNTVETFTLQFADLASNTANLKLLWENTVVDIPIAVEVDSKIAAQMEEFLKEPNNIPRGTYFAAAQYYLTNNKDLGTALDWINAGLVKSPKNFRYGLLKSKIEFKKGDKNAAIKTINQAYTWAKEANNANYMEQTSLFLKSIQ